MDQTDRLTDRETGRQTEREITEERNGVEKNAAQAANRSF